MTQGVTHVLKVDIVVYVIMAESECIWIGGVHLI